MKNYILKKSQVFIIFFLFIGLIFIPLSNYSTLSKRIINEHQIEKEKLCEISENNGSLSGYVFDPLMNPINDALIRVHFHGTYEEDYSDEDGFYHVTNIPICYCMKNCTCSKEGYKTEWVLLGITENTTYDFMLYPIDVYPILDGNQCGGWWNSPVTVSFVFDPEEVAEIWYNYHGWHLYTEPFIVDENDTIHIDYYWINYEGEQSPKATIILEIDQVPPDLYIEWEVYKEMGKWYLKFILTANDYLSGMAPYLEFYINDLLQNTYYTSWPSIEIDLLWNKDYKKIIFGFGCSDNACNFIIEKVNGSEIESVTSVQNMNFQKSFNTIFFKILKIFPNTFYFSLKFFKYVANF